MQSIMGGEYPGPGAQIGIAMTFGYLAACDAATRGPLLPSEPASSTRTRSWFQFIGLYNTLTALVITHLVITVPIVVYIMVGYFETLPRELEEAAQIDGASVWTAFRYVALPLARPGIIVGTILAFVFSWNNFVFGTVLGSRTTRTLPAAVYNVLTLKQLSGDRWRRRQSS